MENNNPVAPTGADAAASVASTTNSNTQTGGEQAPANNGSQAQTQAPAEPTAEQIAKYLGTTTEGLEKFKKFSDNNGGFDKIFAERKQEISAPKNQAAETQQPAQQQQQTAETAKIQGGLDPQDVIAKTYFNSLASEEQYANIAKEIRDGSIFDEMAKLGIQPVVNGQFNDSQIRQFLGLYSKSQPASTASTPTSNIPTAQPNAKLFEGAISSTNDVLRVLQENNQLIQEGKAEHPKLKEANEFLSRGFAERHPQQHDFESWEARKARKQANQ